MKRIELRHPWVAIYAIPIVLAASTAVGLAAGVLGDGVWDVVSWIALGLPLAVVARHLLRPRLSLRPGKDGAHHR